jgi:hypothetical protein
MNKKLVIRGLLLGVAAPILVALLFVAGFAMQTIVGFEDGFWLL